MLAVLNVWNMRRHPVGIYLSLDALYFLNVSIPILGFHSRSLGSRPSSRRCRRRSFVPQRAKGLSHLHKEYGKYDCATVPDRIAAQRGPEVGEKEEKHENYIRNLTKCKQQRLY